MMRCKTFGVLKARHNRAFMFAFFVFTPGFSLAQTEGQLAKFGPLGGLIDSVVTEDSAGNIGIGTTTPAANLDVNGVIKGDGSGLSNAFVKINQTSVAADTSNVTISGLDLNTHGAYKIIVKLRNPFDANFDYRMYMNGDTTASNYFSNMQFTASAIGLLQRTDATITLAGRLSNHAWTIYVTKSTSGKHVTYGHGGFETTPFTNSNVQIWNFFMAHNDTVNLTSITFNSSMDNGIAAGSEIIVYQGM